MEKSYNKFKNDEETEKDMNISFFPLSFNSF